ncbi:hypothetical protein acdb102_37730 [Acidothermaceae bacterium B102]|nr:hypothetical protein acdb102_37730 [Acidothermaceae bacterium B102]
MSSPLTVTLHVWSVRRRHVPLALLEMAKGTRRIRREPGVTFAKQLGTGGDRFVVKDADPLHWATLMVWDDPAQAANADDHPVVRRWNTFAQEQWRADLRPISTHGKWSRKQPFGTIATPEKHDGPIAAITRARLRASKATTFWQAVPPVADSLRGMPGLITTIGIGEAPIGVQGTFSLWESAEDLKRYAYEAGAHQQAIQRTSEVGWYGEELFARFAVIRTTGTLHRKPINLP